MKRSTPLANDELVPTTLDVWYFVDDVFALQLFRIRFDFLTRFLSSLTLARDEDREVGLRREGQWLAACNNVRRLISPGVVMRYLYVDAFRLVLLDPGVMSTSQERVQLGRNVLEAHVHGGCAFIDNRLNLSASHFRG